MAMVEMAQVPEAFVEVTVHSTEGQCSFGRRRRVLCKNGMQESMVSVGRFPVHTAELLTRLERGEEAWVPDLQSSDDSADEGPVIPTLKRLPKGGMWWGLYRSPVMYPSSDSSNSDDELESGPEEEKPQCVGQRLTILHRNFLPGSRGNGSLNLKLSDAWKNGPQVKKHPRIHFGDVSESTVKERTATGDCRSTCPDCGQSFRSKLSLSNHQRKHTRERPYRCYCCGERFMARKALAAHVINHAEEKGYKRPSTMKIITKLQTVQAEERSYKCTQCEKSFKVKDHLLQHEKIHSKERPHKCPTCAKGFIRKEHLTRHQKIHRRQKSETPPKAAKVVKVESSLVAPPKKPSVDPEGTVALNTRQQRFSINRFKCQFCGRCLRAKTLLVDHERSHKEERRYKCTYCNKSFYHKYHFQKHTSIHLRRQSDCKPPKRTNLPSAKSSPSDSINSHMAENSSESPAGRKIITRSFHLAGRLKYLSKRKVFKCQHCGKCLSTSTSLIHHERIHRGEKPYKCLDCGESFHQKLHLDRHLVKHTNKKPLKHGKNKRRLNVRSSIPVPGRSNTGLKPHEGLIHEHTTTRNSHFTRQPKIHTEDRFYKCKFCGEVLRTENLLLSHERTHRGAKRYKCLECGKSFSQKNYLGCHQRSHKRKKPYQCLDSDKSLTTKNASLSCGSPQGRKLPYVCLECGKSFDEKYYLSRHQIIHTGTKPFKCATCGKGFIQNWHLKRHERTHLRGKNRKWPAELEESPLFSSAANGISSEKKDQKDPPVNIDRQLILRTGERDASLRLKVAEMEPLAGFEGSEMGVSRGSEQGEMPIEAAIKHQTVLSRKSKRNQYFKQSKNDLSQQVQPTKYSEKITQQSLKRKNFHAGQPLGLQANAVRKSLRETQVTGKQCRSCFCQQDEPGMTPGRKSKNSQTCMKVKTYVGPQRKQWANLSSNMSKRGLKSCRPDKAYLSQQSQKMLSGEYKMEATGGPGGKNPEWQEALGGKVGVNFVSQSSITEKSEAADHHEQRTLPSLPKSNVEKNCGQVKATNELKSTALQNMGVDSADWQMEAQLTPLKPVQKLHPQSCDKEREPETSASEEEVAVSQGQLEKLQFKHVCTKCNKSFRSPENLVKHKKHHAGHRPFQCSHCEKSFYVLPSFNVHMRIHTGEKPYKCSECPFRCNVSSNLSRHKRTHARKRSRACQLCKKRFWFSQSLLMHLKTHSEEKPYKCSVGGRVFGPRRRFKRRSEAVERPREEEHLQSPGDLQLA